MNGNDLLLNPAYQWYPGNVFNDQNKQNNKDTQITQTIQTTQIQQEPHNKPECVDVLGVIFFISILFIWYKLLMKK